MIPASSSPRIHGTDVIVNNQQVEPLKRDRSSVGEISAIMDADDQLEEMEDVHEAKNLIKTLSSYVQGKIIVAEDQLINIQVLKGQMQEFNLVS